MRPRCNFICLVLFTFCPLARERWVQRLKNLVDYSAHPIEIWARPETAIASSKVDRVAKKTESIRTSETAPLQRPEETTLVHLTDSNDWLDFDTTQENSNTEMASESVGTRGRTRIQRADESTVVHLKESAYFCMQPEGE
ncbi:unnamed protein product [Leuciscus chuanchicus]